MRFKGWLRSPGEAHRGLPVTLDIDETGITVSASGQVLGSWAPYSVALERGDGATFLLQVDGEDWFFEPDDVMRLLFEGLPTLARAQSVMGRPARVDTGVGGPGRGGIGPGRPRPSGRHRLARWRVRPDGPR